MLLYLSHSHIYCIIILFSEISKEKQHRAYGHSEVNDDQAQIYSEIGGDPYVDIEDGDSIGIETNPAYKPIDGDWTFVLVHLIDILHFI